jgi:2-dehydropantoate 2-reductase
MRIAVVGSGALGLFYGALLQRAGHDVRFLLRRDYDAIQENGLQVLSINGDFHLPTVAGFRCSEEIGTVDLVVIGLKSWANGHYSRLVGPLVGPATMILTLQNGLGNEQLLAELFGAHRVYGGVAYLCANRGEPGLVHHLGAGRIILGALHVRNRERADEIAALFTTAGVSCHAVSEIMKARWEKLVWNVPFNGLCAHLQRSVGELLSSEKMTRVIRNIMGEVISAANAQKGQEPISPDYADEMITFTRAMTGSYRPSMQLDRLEGRPLELEALIAKPLEAGEKQGVAMPLTAALYALLDLP